MATQSSEDDLSTKDLYVRENVRERLPLSASKDVLAKSRMSRIRTAARSFRVLRHLTTEQVDAFILSYIIYDLDWTVEDVMIDNLGADYKHKVSTCLVNYYSVLNHLCAIGGLEKMYIPPVMNLHAGLAENQRLYEELIARELRLSANSKILDLGCGRGRVAAHIAMLSGSSVTGLNIDEDQLQSAISFNKLHQMSNEFVRADFNDLPLPFPDNYFDGFYQIQAFSLCGEIAGLCQELYRVLKPGARLSLLDWVSLDAFDAQNAHHRRLMRATKPLIGAIGTPTPVSLAKALESAGFRVLEMKNSSIDGLQAPLIERADIYFRAARAAILSLVKLRLLPPHFKTLFNRLTQDCDAFIEADRSRLVTTSYHWLAEKTISDML